MWNLPFKMWTFHFYPIRDIQYHLSIECVKRLYFKVQGTSPLMSCWHFDAPSSSSFTFAVLMILCNFFGSNKMLSVTFWKLHGVEFGITWELWQKAKVKTHPELAKNSPLFILSLTNCVTTSGVQKSKASYNINHCQQATHTHGVCVCENYFHEIFQQLKLLPSLPHSPYVFICLLSFWKAIKSESERACTAEQRQQQKKIKLLNDNTQKACLRN